MFEAYPEIVTVSDLQEMLNIGRNTAYKLVKSGGIKAFYAGGKLRITKSEIIKFIESGGSKHD